MTIELRGYELDMSEWLKKHDKGTYNVFIEIMSFDERTASSDTYVAAVLDDVSPDRSADVHPIDFFREFRDGVLGELDDSIRELSRGDLAELVRLTAVRYACQLYKGDDRLGRNLLFFNAFRKVYDEVHSDSAVRRRETLAIDGWHGRLCMIYPDDKNPQALLNAYRQGQYAKRDGRECGCAACVAEAHSALGKAYSDDRMDDDFAYEYQKTPDGAEIGAYSATIGDPVPAFPATDDETPF